MRFTIISDFSEADPVKHTKTPKAKRSASYPQIKKTLRKLRVHDKSPPAKSHDDYVKHWRVRTALAGSLKKYRPSDRAGLPLKKAYHATRGGHHAAAAHWALNKAGEIRRKHGKGPAMSRLKSGKMGQHVYGGIGSTAKDMLKASKRYSRMAKKKGHRLENWSLIPDFSEAKVKTTNKIKKKMWKTGPFHNNPYARTEKPKYVPKKKEGSADARMESFTVIPNFSEAMSKSQAHRDYKKASHQTRKNARDIGVAVRKARRGPGDKKAWTKNLDYKKFRKSSGKGVASRIKVAYNYSKGRKIAPQTQLGLINVSRTFGRGKVGKHFDKMHTKTRKRAEK